MIRPISQTVIALVVSTLSVASWLLAGPFVGLGVALAQLVLLICFFGAKRSWRGGVPTANSNEQSLLQAARRNKNSSLPMLEITQQSSYKAPKPTAPQPHLTVVTETKPQDAQSDAMTSDESSLQGGNISSPSNNSEDGGNETGATFEVALQPLPEEDENEPAPEETHPTKSFVALTTDEEQYYASDEYSSSSDGLPTSPSPTRTAPPNRAFAIIDIGVSREESLGSMFAASSSEDERRARRPKLPPTHTIKTLVIAAAAPKQVVNGTAVNEENDEEQGVPDASANDSKHQD